MATTAKSVTLLADVRTFLHAAKADRSFDRTIQTLARERGTTAEQLLRYNGFSSKPVPARPASPAGDRELRAARIRARELARQRACGGPDNRVVRIKRDVVYGGTRYLAGDLIELPTVTCAALAAAGIATLIESAPDVPPPGTIVGD